jgi:hypothetical protein
MLFGLVRKGVIFVVISPRSSFGKSSRLLRSRVDTKMLRNSLHYQEGLLITRASECDRRLEIEMTIQIKIVEKVIIPVHRGQSSLPHHLHFFNSPISFFKSQLPRTTCPMVKSIQLFPNSHCSKLHWKTKSSCRVLSLRGCSRHSPKEGTRQ